MSSHERNRQPLRRKLSEEERTLWGRITRSVAPLRRRKLSSALEAPERIQDHRVAATRESVPAGKPVLRIERLDRRQKQRLARGTQPIDGRLDLHGRSQAEAHAALLRFLRGAQADGAKFVLVITGKGSRGRADADARGVLQRQVPLWLSLPEFRRYVIGFEPAGSSHGGEGALYVRVRRVR
jgi:DNA-nicking Smr family endonuclease